MYYIITNPASASGSSHEKILQRIKQVLESHHIRFSFQYTKKREDPQRIASQITRRRYGDKDEDTLIVIGGDGTINGVINGIHDFAHVRFGFIPAGSANDLAKGLGMTDIGSDRSSEELIRHIAQGLVRRTIDLGRIEYDSGSRLFAVSAGTGFDAAVCRQTEVSRMRYILNRMHMGNLSYGLIAVKELITTPVTECDILMDGGKMLHIDRLVFATFMNTPFEGGGYRFAPDAVCDDAMINVSCVGDMSKLKVLINFPSAHAGTYYKVRGVYHAMAPGMSVKTGMPLWVHTDGEVIGKMSQLHISVLPHTLRMIV